MSFQEETGPLYVNAETWLDKYLMVLERLEYSKEPLVQHLIYLSQSVSYLMGNASGK